MASKLQNAVSTLSSSPNSEQKLPTSKSCCSGSTSSWRRASEESVEAAESKQRESKGHRRACRRRLIAAAMKRSFRAEVTGVREGAMETDCSFCTVETWFAV